MKKSKDSREATAAIIFQSILSAYSDPSIILNRDGEFICMNTAMRALLDQDATTQGKKVSTLTDFGIEIENKKLEEAYSAPGSMEQHITIFSKGLEQAFTVKWNKIASIAESASHLLGIFKIKDSPPVSTTRFLSNPLTGKMPELEAVLQSISDGVYVGNMQGVSFANQAAMDSLGVADIKDLQVNISTLTKQLNARDAITKTPLTLEQIPFARALAGETVSVDLLIQDLKTNKEKIVRSAAAPVVFNGQIIAAVAVNTDVTLHRQAESRLRESEERQAFLLTLSDAIRNITDTHTILEVATRMLGEHLCTDRAFYARMDEHAQQSFVEHEFVRHQSISLLGPHQYTDFGVAVTTMSAGRPFIADDVSTVAELNPQRENYEAMEFNSLMATPLIKNGEMVACMCVSQCKPRHWTKNELLLLEQTAERTWDAVERAHTEVALLQSETEFRTFVAASSDMVYRMSADWTKMYLISSKDFSRANERIKINWMDRYIPLAEQPRLWAAINHAISQKSLFEMEHEVLEADGEIGWRHSRAIPVFEKDGEIKEWLATASNITQRKRAQRDLQQLTLELEQQVAERTNELQESRDQLQLVFDTTLMQISILQAVRNEEGEILDLKIIFGNKELERETGRNDLVGLYYVAEYPGIKETGLFDMIKETIETGIPQQREYFYPHEEFNKWYSCMFVKLGDGVVASNMDITAGKLAQEERLRNYVLLQQSEELAALGSWDYDLNSKKFSWSDGMYRLFNLDRAVLVRPEIYLECATEKGMPAAEHVVNHINSGAGGFNETLELMISGQVKIFHLKGTVIHDKSGLPAKVLGVNMDITATRAAEDTIRRLEARQQQEIFRVTLASQEEERRRISESLHNGLAQTLYGIKMSISHLTPQKASESPEAFLKTKSYTEQLLSGAIAESRKISHELMPTILEDFGLKAAIGDICKQLTSSIKFECSFSGLTQRLDRYMELAVFRTVQELILNVVKHSEARNAFVRLNFGALVIRIQVSDDGKGMEDAKSGTGIGLASIRSKVKLLNGQLNIDSKAGSGTIVNVDIPNHSIDVI